MNVETLEDRAVPATFNLISTAASESWNNIAAWDNGSAFPNANVDIANLNVGLTSPQTISLNQAITVNQLNIGNSAGAGNSITIAPGGAFVLTLSGTAPQVTSTSSNSNTISTGLSLSANTIFSNTGTGTLSVTGVVSGSAGINVPATSTGVISISGANNFTGTSTVSGKIVLSGGSPLGAGAVTLNGANVTFTGHAGLAPTKFEADNVLTPTVTPPPNQPIQLGTTELNDSNVNDVLPLTNQVFWNHNTQFNYEGFIFVPGSSPVVYSFAENIDDDAYLKIDSTVILNDNQWNVPTQGAISLTPGWHSIDARGQNGGGGAGPSSQNPSPWTGWTNVLGMLINKTNSGSTNVTPGGDWTTITDPGNASFLFEPWAQVPNAVTLTGNNTINADTLTIPNSTSTYAVLVQMNGAITGTGGLTKTGTGTIYFNAANTYGGATVINGGSIITNVAAGISPNSAFTVGSGATLSINGFNESLASLSGNGTVNNTSTTNATLTLNGSGTSTFGGVFTAGGTGTLSVVDTGTGSLFLTGSNTSALTLAAGTLGGGNAAGTGGSIGALSATAGTIAPGLGGTTTGIFNTGNLSMLGGTTLNVNVATTTAGSGYDQLNVTGTVTLGNGTTFPTLNFLPTGSFNGGDSFVIINNDGTDPIVGHFAGLAEQSAFTINGQTYSISYQGGPNGNSVVISLVSPPPTVYVNDNWAGFTAGQIIQDLDSVTPGDQPGVFMTNGFATIADAVNQSLNTGSGQFGTVVVNGGTYASDSVNDQNTPIILIFQSGATASDDFSNDSGPVSIASLALASPATSVQLNNNVNLIFGNGLASKTINANISGNGSLTKVGTGAIILNAGDTYTGSTTINAGKLQEGIIGSIPNTPLIVNAGGTLDMHGFNTTVSELSGSGAGTITSTVGSAVTLTFGDSANLSYAGVILNGNVSVAVTKNGSGTETLSGANTYTGATTINAGTLQIATGASAAAGASGVLADTTAVTIASGAKFDVNGNTETVGSVGGAGNITLGSGALTAGGNNGSTTLSGVVSGTGSFTKQGTGSLTLGGNNTYQGATSIAAGTVVMANANALGSFAGSTTNVSSGATLDIGGNKVDPGEIITVTGSGVGGNGVLVNNGTVEGTVTQLIVNGSITVGGSQKLDVRTNGVTGYMHSSTPGTPFDLTKVGSAEVAIGVSDDPDLRNIGVNTGKLTFEANNSIGQATATATVNSGATLSFLSASGVSTNVKNITLSGTLLSDGSAGGSNVIGSSTTTVTLSGTPTIQTNVPGSIASNVTGTAGFTKTGTSSLTLSSTTNDYAGTLSITAGILDDTNPSALGSTAAGTVVGSGGTLMYDGTFAFPAGESLSIAGTGQGNIGAIDKTNGSGTISQVITLTNSATFNVATAGDKLTLSGSDVNGNSLEMPAVANVSFTGAGNVEVVNSFGNGNAIVSTPNTLNEFLYPGQFVNDNLPVNAGETPHTGIGFLNLTQTNSTLLNANLPLSFNTAQLVARSEASGTGIAATTTAMNANGNKFGAVWSGNINVTAAGWVSFGSNTDDGSAIYVDVDQDGIFERQRDRRQ